MSVLVSVEDNGEPTLLLYVVEKGQISRTGRLYEVADLLNGKRYSFTFNGEVKPNELAEEAFTTVQKARVAAIGRDLPFGTDQN